MRTSNAAVTDNFSRSLAPCQRCSAKFTASDTKDPALRRTFRPSLSQVLCSANLYSVIPAISGRERGSVACSEATGELKAGTRNRWFILFTNVMIDWGFVIGAFIPYLLVVICTENHLRAAWRISLGLGVLPPLILLWLRIKLQEPEEFKK